MMTKNTTNVVYEKCQNFKEGTSHIMNVAIIQFPLEQIRCNLQHISYML